MGNDIGTWTGLAPYYDRLLPPGRAQLDFVTRVLAAARRRVRRLLDVGCATGGYALALADLGFDVVGVDLDPEMVRKARAKAEEWSAAGRALLPGSAAGGRGPEPRFIVADMTCLERLPGVEEASFDGAICLGNTLAHALSAAELGATLGGMAGVLRPGGRGVLQTVNYDRLAATGEARFPPVAIKGLNAAGPAAGGVGPSDAVDAVDAVVDATFRRLYLPRADGLVDFVTTLEETRSGRPLLRSATILRPVRRDELETVARLAFHGEVETWGDFLFSSWSEASPATVVVATRGED